MLMLGFPTVFDQEFQVHSLMLKIGSQFFRKFMDSADKTPAPAGAEIRYEYRSVVDDDGETWGLEAVSKIVEGPQVLLEHESDWEVRCFEYMLRCIYSQPFKFTTILELGTLAKLAEFYIAAPAVSVALDGALVRSLASIEPLIDQAGFCLDMAYKLRNEFLYKESMVYVAGDWWGNWDKCSYDDELRRCITIANAGIMFHLDQVNREFSCISTSNPDTDPQNSNYIDYAISQRIQHHTKEWRERRECKKTLASLYAAIWDDPFEFAPVDRTNTKSARERVRQILRPLLKNNLALDKNARAGQGVYSDCFLSAEVADEDLPWDPKETDW
ncbi:hypothetical protein D0Z07_3582 [Hyphodiscus hymeniophilus]|uniref:BTB domain-containing protein n=1 Tax=Hyphodiscus hymeniophilus TaxID=353542 RepID=A0A9P6VLT8_9HELO|nr:hypothetical protein D0Z07_3582 [Hyphodiscus hymeniophilus]